MVNEHDNSGLIVLTSGVGVGVKGAYVDFINPVTVTDTYWLTFQCQHPFTGMTICNVDIAVGAPGAEVIKIPDMYVKQLVSGTNLSTLYENYSHPWKFLNGDRIRCRCADDNAGATNYNFSLIVYQDNG